MRIDVFTCLPQLLEPVFGGSLQSLTETAYAAAGAPWRYMSERSSREG